MNSFFHGLSPHGRGNLRRMRHFDANEGLSPHGRGNPHSRTPVPDVADRVYPRTGGGTDTPSCRPRDLGAAVYPRTGGGTAIALGQLVSGQIAGLSPHGRGNHVIGPSVRACRLPRSIPARAGEPFTYVRAELYRRCHGSIPARAGEPAAAKSAIGHSWVYPRTGGGTGSSSGRARHDPGLSPHGRGNLRIPLSPMLQIGKVYPRTGGGTGKRLPNSAISAMRSGSIPARAGEPESLCRTSHQRHRRGSIPARAGEPGSQCVPTWSRSPGVYPRTGGGTMWGKSLPWRIVPSVYPRTGGGTLDLEVRARSTRSRVYPRTGGGTTVVSAIHRHLLAGVYPRTGGGTLVEPAAEDAFAP